MQTEQSAALETDVREQKEMNRQLITREDMKHYIQLLQLDIEKRCSEAVISAARLREAESRLRETQLLHTTQPPPSPPLSPPSLHQQLTTEPIYKSENIRLCSLSLRDYIKHCNPSVLCVFLSVHLFRNFGRKLN